MGRRDVTGREYPLDVGPAQRHEDDDDGRVDRLSSIAKESERVAGSQESSQGGPLYRTYNERDEGGLQEQPNHDGRECVLGSRP